MPSKLLVSSEIWSHDATVPSNMSYVAAELLKGQRIYKQNALERINLGSIAKLSLIPEASVVYILKQIVMAIEHTME